VKRFRVDAPFAVDTHIHLNCWHRWNLTVERMYFKLKKKDAKQIFPEAME
jgi:uncharacterized protein YqcC (DUF446 family)